MSSIEGQKSLEKLEEIEKETKYLHDKRFEKIEKEIMDINEKIDKTFGNVREELKTSLNSLSKELYELKIDYEMTKGSLFKTIEKMEELPNAINSLEKTIITINMNLDLNTKKTEELQDMIKANTDAMSEKIKNVEKNVFTIKDKTKFDWMEWIKSMIPLLISSGIVYLIMQLIQG